MGWDIIEADCVQAMAAMDGASVDAVVCDPPYGLEFMGKDWDRLSGQPGYNERGRIVDRPNQPYGARTGERVNSYQAGRPMQEWHEAWAREALRVLKPGGHLLAFGGTRTYHRLACAIEDAGFEIRDTIAWMYGSGFPKSLDVSKAIDKGAGAEREVVGRSAGAGSQRTESLGLFAAEYDTTIPATPEAQEWDGWGTALKPAHEPIVVARKPLSGTVAATVLEHGTGALNVDGCRIDHQTVNRGNLADNPHIRGTAHRATSIGGNGIYGGAASSDGEFTAQAGRWPANVVLSHHPECGEKCGRCGGLRWQRRVTLVEQKEPGYERRDFCPESFHDGFDGEGDSACHSGCPVRLLDKQTGDLPSQATRTDASRGGNAGMFGLAADGARREYLSESGGASRFFANFKHQEDPWTLDTLAAGEHDQVRFHYTPKASACERNAGLDGFEPGVGGGMHATATQSMLTGSGNVRDPMRQNVHPTVKPIALMRWLVRLVTPPGGLILDPFAGSGTTGIAAVLEGFRFVGIEREAEYAAIARARVEWWSRHPDGMELVERLEHEKARKAVAESGQLGMFDA